MRPWKAKAAYAAVSRVFNRASGKASRLYVLERADESDGGFVWSRNTITDWNNVVPSGTPPLVIPGGINDVGQTAITSWPPNGTSLSFILIPIAGHSY